MISEAPPTFRQLVKSRVLRRPHSRWGMLPNTFRNERQRRWLHTRLTNAVTWGVGVLLVLALVAAGRAPEMTAPASVLFIVTLVVTLAVYRLAGRLVRATHVAVGGICRTPTTRRLVRELRAQQGFLTVGQCEQIGLLADQELQECAASRA